MEVHDHEHHHHHHDHDHGNDQELINLVKQTPLKDRQKVIALAHHLGKKKALDEELEEKISQLQKEFDMQALPFFEQMNQVITGVRAPTKEELGEINNYFTPEEQAQKEEFIGNSDPIPLFWHTVLKNCQSLSHVFTENEKDLEILKSLVGLQVEFVGDKEDFTLRFVFSDNEYFTNKELTKTFVFPNKKDKCEPSFPSSTNGSKVEWKEGMNITRKAVQKKQKNKKTGATRTVKKEVDQESFFNFFKCHEVNEDLEQEEKEKQEYKLEDDFEVGRTLADDVIPYALEYFLGINPEEEDFEDVDDEDDEKGDDKDDDDDDEESDDDKKKKKSKKSKSKEKPKAAEPTKEGPPAECKQQ